MKGYKFPAGLRRMVEPLSIWKESNASQRWTAAMPSVFAKCSKVDLGVLISHTRLQTRLASYPTISMGKMQELMFIFFLS